MCGEVFWISFRLYIVRFVLDLVSLKSRSHQPELTCKASASRVTALADTTPHRMTQLFVGRWALQLEVTPGKK